MLRKFSRVGVAAILLVLVLTIACGPQQAAQNQPAPAVTKAAAGTPQRGGTLRVGFDGEPGQMDPTDKAAGGTLPWRYSRFLYNNLTNTDASGKVIPDLAESWSTTDNKVFTFKLRKGVKFHDGTDFNAQTAKFTIDRDLSKDVRPSVGQLLTNGGLKSTDIVDDYTIQFTLELPNASFPAILTTPPLVMMSPTAIKKWGDQYALHPVGTGPFEFSEWAKGDHLTLKRFNEFWRKDAQGNSLPYLDELIVKPIPDDAMRLAGLRTGNLDLIDYIAPTELPTVQADGNLKSETWGTISYTVVLNCAKPPFNNKALRQSLAWSVDRDALHKVIYGGTGEVANAPLVAGNWAYDPNGKFYSRDLAQAKQKLAEGGQANGFKFNVVVYNLPLDLRLAQAMAGQMAEAGIMAEVSPVEKQQTTTLMTSGNFEAIFVTAYGMPEDPDIEYTRNFSTKGVYNFGKCSDPQLDSLIQQAEQVVDQTQRKALYAKAQAMVLDESRRLYLHHNATITAMNKNVQGFVKNIDLNRLEFDTLWLQK